MTAEPDPGPPLLTTAVPSFAMAWKALIHDHRVPDGAVRLYLALSIYARPDRPVAWPGQERLATELNVSVKTIQRSARQLADTGWIRKVRRGRGRSNLYHLMMPGPMTPHRAVDRAVGDVDGDDVDATDLSLQEATDLSLPYEVEPGEEQTPLTPRKRGTGGGSTRRAQRRALTAEERADDFHDWWQSYPRKVGKIEAERAWRQMMEADRLPSLDTLVAASEALARRTAREHPEATEWVRYVPHPSTWLRRGDYLDLEASPDRPPVRNPCALCGVPDPCVERCLGVGQGRISSTEDCIWA